MDTRLPDWQRVLVVVAHPDDESFGLGAIVSEFTAAGAEVSVLCFTAGEASTLGAAPDLAATRTIELQTAAEYLGCRRTLLRDFPDGGLATLPAELSADIAAACDELHPDGLLIFAPDGGITGHPDHEAASRAALAVAAERGLPVLAWGLPLEVTDALNQEFGAGFTGHAPERFAVGVRVDRARQMVAVHDHASQAVPGSVLWRRLELQGDREFLLLYPAPTSPAPEES